MRRLSNTKKLTVSLSLLTLSLLLPVITNAAGSVEDNAKVEAAVESNLIDIKGHWSRSAIEAAVNRGYVNGYPDDTFKPDNPITRAEFMKMLAAAIQLPVNPLGEGEEWFEPFVHSLESVSIHRASEFDEEFHHAITRLEVARMAVRTAKEEMQDPNVMMDDYSFLYNATKLGILQGVGDGELAPEGNTTRAQAVTIIERILAILSGETLPVDEQAVASAKARMDAVHNAELDEYGRVIRTWDLPENYEDWPYILADVPNEMYEMGYPFTPKPQDFKTAAEMYATAPQMTRENIDKWVERINTYYGMVLNVDYETIDDSWGDVLFENINQMVNKESTLRKYSEYVAWVKENKIKIEGSIEPEPSMFYLTGWNFIMRAKVKFRILEYKENKNIIYDDYYNDNSGDIKKGVWYGGYADIYLGQHNIGDWGPYLAVLEQSIWSNATIKELK